MAFLMAGSLAYDIARFAFFRHVAISVPEAVFITTETDGFTVKSFVPSYMSSETVTSAT